MSMATGNKKTRIIAIASGKGGTGKTTVAVNLAMTATVPVRLLDCDVEEPNCHLFVKPVIHKKSDVCVLVPEVDESLCNVCGECADFCRFGAIVSLKTKPLVFPDLCHGCGGCFHVCSREAIREVPYEVGVIESGMCGKNSQILFAQGRLNVGRAKSPPIIRQLKRELPGQSDPPARQGIITIIDAPPGTSCPFVSAVSGCDLVLLVTEPTPFGLHDMKLAVESLKQLALPVGAVINRVAGGSEIITQYCQSEKIPVYLEIPDDRRIAEAYSCGRIVTDAVADSKGLFERLWAAIP
ncbi:MAG: hypothetical protein A2583_12685 [Bdellovibrionales bacterium RIFOXYD1_FULL_53_11]|nr:MAG: hypothetical protein A2583_12685 [Bdellovibrionales bacterium RIFOXYD1_FULL_53_11]